MGVQPTDLMLVERGAAQHKATVAEVVALAAGGASPGVATITLPGAQGVFEWTESVAAPGVLETDTILAVLAAGGDADENTADMLDLVSLAAVAGAGTISFTITLSTPCSGPIKLIWKVL